MKGAKLMSKIFLKSVLIVLLMASCSNQNTADNEKKAEEIALGHSGVVIGDSNCLWFKNGNFA